MKIFSIIALCVVSLPMLAMIFDKLFLKKNPFFCKLIGWHRDVEVKSFDGCSSHGVCGRCQQKVLQDSNGDWF